ncbi:hypothetical protein DFH09DRAFT_1322445 [Mycena vulgaris]|nr:hypothetical protein DFH09DRAFT_1322445 [Mycena vulgaris]
MNQDRQGFQEARLERYQAIAIRVIIEGPSFLAPSHPQCRAPALAPDAVCTPGVPDAASATGATDPASATGAAASATAAADTVDVMAASDAAGATGPPDSAGGIAVLRTPGGPPRFPFTTARAGAAGVAVTAGVAESAALHLAQRAIPTLILAVRTLYKDLDRPASVVSFASKIRAEILTLNILLLNAGMGSLKWETTPGTNTERMFQINPH